MHQADQVFVAPNSKNTGGRAEDLLWIAPWPPSGLIFVRVRAAARPCPALLLQFERWEMFPWL
jgi:hypothetical protein